MASDMLPLMNTYTGFDDNHANYIFPREQFISWFVPVLERIFWISPGRHTML